VKHEIDSGRFTSSFLDAFQYNVRCFQPVSHTASTLGNSVECWAALSSRAASSIPILTVRWLLESEEFQATFSTQKAVDLLLITIFGQILDNALAQWLHMKLYIEKSLIAVDLRSQTCLKVRPERRKKEVKRKLNRELTTIGYSPFFLFQSRSSCDNLGTCQSNFGRVLVKKSFLGILLLRLARALRE
jgi:hypothetical protein